VTAAHTGEVIGARWDEIDLEEKIAVVPGGRMKAEREHRVPLASAAMAVLERMTTIQGDDFVFPGGKKGRPLSSMAMLAVLKRMDRRELTAHGFRSSFRDWGYGPGTHGRRQGRSRGDLFQKRLQIMDAWVRFCEIPGRGDVLPISGRV
jgi:integrase